MQKIAYWDDCMDGREASEYVGLAWTTFMQTYQQKGIDPLRIGGAVWFQKSELDRYLEKAAAQGLQSARVALGLQRAEAERRAAILAGRQK